MVAAVKWSYPRNRRCKVCGLPDEVRDRVDDMILGEEVDEVGRPFSFQGISEWLKGEGHDISESSVRRHARHMSPALERALEMERMVEAVERATGKRIPFASALANIIVHRTLRQLEGLDLSQVEPERLLRIGLQAAEVVLRLERMDRTLKEQVVEKVGQKLKGQIDLALLEELKREVYGL